LGRADPQESEVAGVASDADDRGIYLVEGELLCRHAVASEGAGTEADHTDLRGERGRRRREDLADRTGAIVVGERLLPTGRIETLGAVVRRTAEEQRQPLSWIDADLRDAEEAPLSVHGFAGRQEIERGRHEHCGDSDGERERPSSEREAEHRGDTYGRED